MAVTTPVRIRERSFCPRRYWEFWKHVVATSVFASVLLLLADCFCAFRIEVKHDLAHDAAVTGIPRRSFPPQMSSSDRGEIRGSRSGRCDISRALLIVLAESLWRNSVLS